MQASSSSSSLLVVSMQRCAVRTATRCPVPARHASVLTCVPAVTTTSSPSPAPPSPAKAATNAPATSAASMARPASAKPMRQRVAVVSPYDSATSAFRFILSSRTPASGAATEAFAHSISTPEARRARAIRANRMLNDLEAALSDSHRVLGLLEGRARMLAMHKPATAAAASLDGGSSGQQQQQQQQDGAHNNDDDGRTASASASDRFVTGSLLALSGLVGYTGYVRRNDVFDVFAEGRSPQQECLPLLCGLER
ncbi:hypothetical protein SYNPS1DRAFT_27346 [Syncephalis pseudoplumigaleata]|uniref:Uncharacterized protein n=1 Tax=Syncephalis pseudoplumigaleata TaxID=1712513 RepID=A0A4V1J215_9FUNG|nr:hypothetical protein SYNPS1DRAFT_27346 [Syncephalis pseudoplumigaleata]|eukprot:RKP26979.1 hypothetical protein SYNPS1DRAFT_27346 [Syncephalis pseudoplumigaleata]